MKVKMKSRWQSPTISYKPESIVEVDDSTGRQLIESGCAVFISMSKSEIETQMIRPPENAMMPKPISRTVKKPIKKPAKRR